MAHFETDNISYLALGDSYTIGHGVSPSECFPNILCKEISKLNISTDPPKVIAKTGWTTGDLIKGIADAQLSDNKYDLVSLLIGVNNYYDGGNLETYESEFRELLLKAIDLAKGDRKKVFVLSIPDYGFTPFGQAKQEEISRGVDMFNEANKRITDSLGVLYVDIVPISRRGLTEPDLVAADGLHPSGEMYKLWADVMKNEVVRMVSSNY